jgi:capsular exopolysaccharide synthesis family protein
LGLGVAIVFLRELMVERIQKPEDLEDRGFDLLSTVMNMRSELRQFKGEQKVLVDKKAIDVHAVMITNPLSPIAEAFRHLHTTVHIARRDNPPKKILVTSPNPGEGKTTTVINLAVAYAEAGHDILLLETDLRRPSISSAMDISGKPGLSEVLTGKTSIQQAVQNTVVPNLHVLSCGAIPTKPARLLGSDNMKRLIEELKNQYQVLLFDCAPVLAVTDGLVLSTMMDCIIMVVSAGETSVTALRKAVDLLDVVNAKTTGIVLNKFDLNRGYGLPYDRSSYGYYTYSYKHRSNGQGQDVLAKK